MNNTVGENNYKNINNERVEILLQNPELAKIKTDLNNLLHGTTKLEKSGIERLHSGNFRILQGKFSPRHYGSESIWDVGHIYDPVEESFSNNSKLYGKSWNEVLGDNTLSKRDKTSYYTLRFVQSLLSNKLNRRLATKLGLDSIVVTTDKNISGISANQETIYINIDSVLDHIGNPKDFDKSIDASVFEELIHIIAQRSVTVKEDASFPTTSPFKLCELAKGRCGNV